MVCGDFLKILANEKLTGVQKWPKERSFGFVISTFCASGSFEAIKLEILLFIKNCSSCFEVHFVLVEHY